MTWNLKWGLVLQNIVATFLKWLHFLRSTPVLLKTSSTGLMHVLNTLVWCMGREIFERDPNCLLDASLLLMQLIHLLWCRRRTSWHSLCIDPHDSSYDTEVRKVWQQRYADGKNQLMSLKVVTQGSLMTGWQGLMTWPGLGQRFIWSWDDK